MLVCLTVPEMSLWLPGACQTQSSVIVPPGFVSSSIPEVTDDLRFTKEKGMDFHGVQLPLRFCAIYLILVFPQHHGIPFTEEKSGISVSNAIDTARLKLR